MKPKLYPTSVLRDSKTGKPFMLPRGKHDREIRKAAKASAKQTLKALNDPTGMTLI